MNYSFGFGAIFHRSVFFLVCGTWGASAKRLRNVRHCFEIVLSSWVDFGSRQQSTIRSLLNYSSNIALATRQRQKQVGVSVRSGQREWLEETMKNLLQNVQNRKYRCQPLCVCRRSQVWARVHAQCTSMLALLVLCILVASVAVPQTSMHKCYPSCQRNATGIANLNSNASHNIHEYYCQWICINKNYGCHHHPPIARAIAILSQYEIRPQRYQMLK